jgi:hypothetical protein
MGRLNGLSDKDIAEKLKCGSIAHLYRRLSDDGYPVCSACGAAPIDKKQHACEAKRQPGPGTGKRTELPDVSRASELFAGTLRSLLANVADLEFRHDSSQDGRVVSMDEVEGSSYVSRWHVFEKSKRGKTDDLEKQWNKLCRAHNQDPAEERFSVELFSEEQWNEICARAQQDPSLEGFRVDDTYLRRPAGTARHPAEPETTLIGVYALVGGDMEQLLEALYPGTPNAETREAIRKRVEGKKKPDNIDGLRTIAGQLATLVRGQSLAGAPPPGLTPFEHDAACYITMLRDEKKHSDEEILAKLSNHRMADGSTPSMVDVQRLGNLRLRYDQD